MEPKVPKVACLKLNCPCVAWSYLIRKHKLKCCICQAKLVLNCFLTVYGLFVDAVSGYKLNGPKTWAQTFLSDFFPK